MIYTIGVYGYSEEDFFNRLKLNGIKTFWDIRSRRGMRGTRYSFVNAKYLEQKLKDINISYRHVKMLAPNDETRGEQRYVDKSLKVLKSERQIISEKFLKSYEDQFTENDWLSLANLLKQEDGSTVFFCVEAIPEACHRSIAARKIALLLSSSVHHII